MEHEVVALERSIMQADERLRMQLELIPLEGAVQALRHATLEARPGEAIGIVGESGCGKSTLASAFITLLARNARVTSGGVRFGGQDILARSFNSELGAALGQPVIVEYRAGGGGGIEALQILQRHGAQHPHLGDGGPDVVVDVAGDSGAFPVHRILALQYRLPDPQPAHGPHPHGCRYQDHKTQARAAPEPS